jgi:hypothetical protein
VKKKKKKKKADAPKPSDAGPPSADDVPTAPPLKVKKKVCD